MFFLFDGVNKIDSSKTKGGISDGTHSFDELYDHRCTLFAALMKCKPNISWYADVHDDGEVWDGWILCGIDLPEGTVTYHLPVSMRKTLKATGAKELPRGKPWDGHTSNDVLKRLGDFING